MNATAGKQVLVIDDDASLNRLLTDQISRIGFQAHGARSRAEAVAVMETLVPDLMIIDVRLPDGNGLDLLQEFGGRCPIIMLTAYGSVDQAVRAVHSGASDYLLKPVSFQNLELAVQRAFATVELKRDVRYWQSQAQRIADTRISGESQPVEEMRSLISLYAAAGSTVLIEGESGVGKELVARAIHEGSNRAQARFVPIDCDPMQENLTASELFGHEQGAFPGADTMREGMLEVADKGTIFLSDIAEISLALQSKLLRVMETGVFRRLGGAQDMPADVRILAATSRDLGEMVREERFRSELFYRLSAFCIKVPPLRMRRGDVSLLARHFLQSRGFLRGQEKALAPETLEVLEAYSWPGNVRELRNAVERGLIMSGDSAVILPQHVAVSPGGSGIAGGDDSVSLSYPHEPTLDQMRDDYLRLLLARHEGNRHKVAGILGMSERNTYRLINKLDKPE